MLTVQYLSYEPRVELRLPTLEELSWIKETSCRDKVMFEALLYNQIEIVEFILKLFGFEAEIESALPVLYETKKVKLLIDNVSEDKKGWL